MTVERLYLCRDVTVERLYLCIDIPSERLYCRDVPSERLYDIICPQSPIPSDEILAFLVSDCCDI